MNTKNARIEINTISVSALIFTCGDTDPCTAHTLYVASNCTLPSYDENSIVQIVERRFPKVGNVKVCQPVEFDQTWGDNDPFYLCFVEDCFDPPCAIVRGENDDLSDVVDDFVENCKWAQIEDVKSAYGISTDAEFEKLFNDGILGITGNGTYYDAEQTVVRQLKLVAIEV